MRLDRALCLVIGVTSALVATACAGDEPATDPTTPSPAADAAPPAASAADASTPPTNEGGTAQARDGGARRSTGLRVDVSGGALPSPVIDGYRTNGGDLVDPAEWSARFGGSPLPRITGPGVVLVEAVDRVEQRDGEWFGTHETSWLAMVDRDRDAAIADLAAAAGLDGTAERTHDTDQGADCVLDTYTASDVTWQVQGCNYEQFPRMVALGVSSSGHSSAPYEGLDATISTLVDVLAAEVTYTEVRLGAPGPDGSTLHLSAHLATDLDHAALAQLATAGPLRDWHVLVGEDSTLLSGPSGATWALSDGVAVFSWAGRW